MLNLRRPLLGTLLAAAVVSLSPRQSFGWIDTGHKEIALIAWADLTPKTRSAVSALLKQHPRYQKDLAEGAPADATPEELDRHVFAAAAVWPDLIRGAGNPMHAEYSHPAWHFIDLPFSVGGQAAVQPPAREASGPQNIVEALTQCTAEVKEANTAPTQKAIDLCWIEHLVGDIHQPLHAASLFSPQFPKGDQGGNAEIILRDPPYPDSKIKLHLLWDELPGDYRSETLDRYIADGLHADPKYSRAAMKDLLSDTDFLDWAKGSQRLAVKDAYLDGNLKAATALHGTYVAKGETVPGVPPGYLENAEHVAMHQVALAGYRLADVLNKTYDPQPTK